MPSFSIYELSYFVPNSRVFSIMALKAVNSCEEQC